MEVNARIVVEYVYGKTLDELRYKEEQIAKDKSDGIKAEARYTTINDLYELWKVLKRGLKNNTFENEQLLKDENAKVLLPHFSCHSLRHTFTTRMCEAGVNVKVIQDTLGHKDISTTLNIYTDVTRELKRSEFEGLDSYFKEEYKKANVG